MSLVALPVGMCKLGRRPWCYYLVMSFIPRLYVLVVEQPSTLVIVAKSKGRAMHSLDRLLKLRFFSRACEGMRPPTDIYRIFPSRFRTNGQIIRKVSPETVPVDEHEKRIA